MLEHVEVDRGLVLGDQGLAVDGAADEGHGLAHLAAGAPGLEGLGGVEHVDPAVLLDFVVVEAHERLLGDGTRGEAEDEQTEACGDDEGLAHGETPP